MVRFNTAKTNSLAEEMRVVRWTATCAIKLLLCWHPDRRQAKFRLQRRRRPVSTELVAC